MVYDSSILVCTFLEDAHKSSKKSKETAFSYAASYFLVLRTVLKSSSFDGGLHFREWGEVA